jgi:hypothetical protein
VPLWQFFLAFSPLTSNDPIENKSKCKIKIMRNILILPTLCFISNYLSAQSNTQVTQDSCITLKIGEKGKDAIALENFPTANFGTHPDFGAWTWTFNSAVGSGRSYIDFDLAEFLPMPPSRMPIFHFLILTIPVTQDKQAITIVISNALLRRGQNLV